jgi:hypothetical protein
MAVAAKAPIWKFMVVQNTTARTQSIVPERVEYHNKSLRIKPFDSVTLRARDWEEVWEDDRSMESATQRGVVAVVPANQRVRSLPASTITGLNNPEHLSICTELVCGPDARFSELIADEVEKDEKRDVFLSYYKETYPAILRAALKWLRAWGPPESMKWRVSAIQERLGSEKK